MTKDDMQSSPMGAARATRLSPEQLDAYERDGFILPGITLPTSLIDRLRAIADEAIASNHGPPDLVRQPHVPRRLGYREGSSVAEQLFPLCLHPQILEPVEQVLGPDIIWYSCLFFAKRALVGREIPWHQDGYLAAAIQPSRAVNLWIAIDACTPENGCLRFIPATHREAIVHNPDTRPDLTFGTKADEERFDTGRAIDSILAPGQFSLHHCLTVHGSNANRSPDRRVGLALAFMSARSWFNRASGSRSGSSDIEASDLARRPLWLVRGENRDERTDLQMGHEGLELFDAWAAEARGR